MLQARPRRGSYYAEPLSDDVRNKRRISDRGQIDENGAVRKVWSQVCRKLQCQARLADSWRTRKCQQADVWSEQQFSDGDYVCTRWSSEGTSAEGGKHVAVTGISIDKIQDGKIVETWNQWDNAGMMQQLGVGQEAGAAA